MFNPYAVAERYSRRALILAVLLALPAAGLPRLALAAPLVTGTLTETGQLLVAGSPVTGSYDLQFQLFNAATGGTQVGTTQSLPAVPVADGVFYAEINFGAVIGTPGLYLQTSYRKAGTTAYTTETPRKKLFESGYADYATEAGYAATAGSAGTASVSNSTKALLTKALSATAPAIGQVLTYNGALWEPQTPAPDATYTAGAGLALAGRQFSILNGGVTASMLGAGSVGAGAIAMPLSLSADNNGGASLLVNNASGYGLYGSSASPVFSGTYGVNILSGDNGSLGGYVNGTIEPAGVIGSDSSNKGFSSYGVYGSSITGFGVYGSSLNSYGVEGDTGGSSAAGVIGSASTAGSVAVYGQNTATGDLGVLASKITLGTATVGVGVYGTDPANGIGVLGTSNTGYGGYFQSGGANGLYGEALATNGNGIVGVANSGSGAYGVYGSSTSGFAGVFVGKVSISGDLHVTGAITAGTKDFKIDDPLDPAGKYLSHACIESDQMADLYSGNAVTDGAGNAVVTLPRWFQSLNTDFRYQLTCLGQFAQAIVATKVHDNAFSIKTDRPNVEVSWQVTGIRRDAYALAHPLQVEEDKPAEEQGLFLHPAEQGQPEEQGIGYQRQLAHEAHTSKGP